MDRADQINEMREGQDKREMQPKTRKTKTPTPISQHAHTNNPSRGKWRVKKEE